MQQFSPPSANTFFQNLSVHADTRGPVITSFIFSLIILLLSLVFYFSLQPVIPLFYSLPDPSEYLAPKEWIFFFPVFSLSVTLLHFLLLQSIRKYEKIIPQLFSWGTLIVQGMIGLAMIRILWIIT